LLLQSLPQRRLAGRGLGRRQTSTAAASRETHVKRPGGLCLEQESSVGIGDGDGVVQHGAEHSLERKPGMEKCGRFEQEIEFMESARGRVAAGYVLDAAEEFGNRGIEQ